MTPELQKLEDSIKKVHKIAFTPKFKETFHTKLSNPAFIAIGLKVVEKLGWDLVFYDESTIEAKRKNKWNNWTEGITMSYHMGDVDIQSESLGNEMWDNGNNSKRVKLFQLVLADMESQLSSEEIRGFVADQKKTDEWEDYKIPESLPEPVSFQKPTIIIPLAGTIGVAGLLGYILAFCISNGFYIIGICDVGVGFLLGLTMAQLVKVGNYTVFNKLKMILIASVLIAFLSCQFFIYYFYISEHPSLNVDFISFMKMRFEAGITIKSFNAGWIGLVISWLLLLFFGYYIGMTSLVAGVVKHQLNRIPKEVLDFAVYLSIKDKSEEQIRSELSKYGWSKTEDQNEVFEALGAVGDAHAMDRS